MRIGSAFTLCLAFCFLGTSAYSQEDTTPPVLLDFTISPTVFDAGAGSVDITVCLTAQDDLSGIDTIILRTTGPIVSGLGGFQLTRGDLVWSGCQLTTTLAQFFPYGEYGLHVNLVDRVANNRVYEASGDPDLCPIGTCLIENLQLTALPDSDTDGVPDVADNCPDDSNANQEDADLDLIGDACDPFPNDHDNEQEQCDVDLAQAQSDLTACEAQQVFTDLDSDGEADGTDACPTTPMFEPVDQGGCSQAQFCSLVDASTSRGRQECRASDWRNDEPLGRGHPGDCLADRLTSMCLPQ